MPVERAHINKKEALNLIANFCSKEERCIADVRKKLCEFELSEDIITEMINYLKKEKYIDENRYTVAFVNDKLKFNKWGKYKISYALKQKKIPDFIAEKALNDVSDDDYRHLLYEELAKKLRSLPKATNYELKGKLYRFASSRGFENDIILETIGELLEE
jgi:regulatory protein